MSLYCTVSALVLEPTISIRSPCSFWEKMVFKNQDLDTRCAHCCRSVAVPRTSQQTELWGRGVCVHIYLHIYLFLRLAFSICREPQAQTDIFHSSLKTTEFISSFSLSIFITPFSNIEKSAFIILYVCTYLISPPVCYQYSIPAAKLSLAQMPSFCLGSDSPSHGCPYRRYYQFQLCRRENK